MVGDDGCAAVSASSTSSPDRPLAGQWAVVTGGSKGIGQGISHRLLQGGAHVVMVARGKESLDEAVVQANAAAPEQQVLGVVADVSSRDSLAELFDDLDHLIPRLDLFVANAGTGQVTPFLELTVEEVDEVVALNLTGTLFSVQRAARAMVDNPGDNNSIVVVSSIRALRAGPGRLIYSATKAAVNQAVRVAALELAPHGIRVNTLSPGITETPLTARNPGAFAEAVANVPVGRAGLPSDLAEGAYFLCSPASRFITGTNLVVDGGESLG